MTPTAFANLMQDLASATAVVMLATAGIGVLCGGELAWRNRKEEP
jgi:hypothetical protein